jgi:hypothetical protein
MHGDDGLLVVAGAPQYEREEEEEREEGADEPEPVLPPLGDPRAGSVPVVVVHEEPLLLDGRLLHPRVPPAPSPRPGGGGATGSAAGPGDAEVGGGRLAGGEAGGGGVPAQRARRGRGRGGVEGRRRRLVVVARGLHVVGRPRRGGGRHAGGHLRVRLRVAVRLLHRRGGGRLVVAVRMRVVEGASTSRGEEEEGDAEWCASTPV